METQAIEKAETGALGVGVMALAKQLATSGLIPRALQGKPGDVLVVLLTGKELGLGPMQSLRGIHVIDGKGVLDAALIVGLVMKHRDLCEYFRLVESTDAAATYEAKRAGHPAPVTLSFTIEQAKAAGLAGKQNWRNFPAAMLRARASTALARALFPDLTAGLYDPDELGHERPPAETPPPSPAPTKRQERAAEDAEVVDAAPAKPPSAKRGGVPNVPGLPGYVDPAALAAQQTARDAERLAVLQADEARLNERLPPVTAPRETVAREARPEVSEALANVAKVLGGEPAPTAVVAFGPHKGRHVGELSDDELSEAIELAHEKLMEQPKAKWAQAMRANLALLEAETHLRYRAKPSQRTPGEEG